MRAVTLRTVNRGRIYSAANFCDGRGIERDEEALRLQKEKQLRKRVPCSGSQSRTFKFGGGKRKVREEGGEIQV